MTAGKESESAPEQAHALISLCSEVLPVWARQLASSRHQSELAVTEMLSAFAEIGPHLDKASRQSGQITAALAQGTDGITQLAVACDQELRPLLAGLQAPATAAVERVLAMVHASVSALEQIAKPFAHETQMVSEQVERMYKGFQYQDRISQMMTLLHQDIERLQAALLATDADTNVAAWLARLETQYVMTEQRHQHNPGAGEVVADDDETTFF